MHVGALIFFVLITWVRAQLPPLDQTRTGSATFYDLSGTGSCGTPLMAGQKLVAVSHLWMKAANPNLDPVCQLCVRVSYEQRTMVLPVMDTCPSCSLEALDISRDAMIDLGGGVESLDLGVFQNIQWSFVSCSAGTSTLSQVVAPVTQTAQILSQPTQIIQTKLTVEDSQPNPSDDENLSQDSNPSPSLNLIAEAAQSKMSNVATPPTTTSSSKVVAATVSASSSKASPSINISDSILLDSFEVSLKPLRPPNPKRLALISSNNKNSMPLLLLLETDLSLVG